MSGYNKSCLDEIDFEKVEQMHAAALQISKTCFDFKKLCVTFLGVSMAFLIKFTSSKIDHSLFIIGLILIVGFWISDATAYYYQRKLRHLIDSRFKEIAIRNNKLYDLDASIPSVQQSMFNSSMWLYYILFILFVGGWATYFLRWIG